MAQIHVRRIYEEPNRSDGFRVLVDRLWPRGISKERAALDLWMKTVAPSTELRQRFGHDPKRWKDFVRRYRAELRDHTLELAELRSRARNTVDAALRGEGQRTQ
jgi:uncharacterized protein YeaO (DUF488 family)